MTTVDATVDAVLGHLLDGQREARNVLTTTLDDNDTSVVLDHHPRGAQEGARVSIDFEDMYVFNTDVASQTLTVLRGDAGSTAAAHTSGAIVWVNPKWSRFQVLRAVNAELAALPARGVVGFATLDLTFSAPVAGYDLDGLTPDDVLDIYEVLADQPGPATHWRPISSWRLVRDAPDDFPSGLGIVLNESGYPGHTVRVTYKTRFTAATPADGGDDLTEVAGIDANAHELVALGAALRLLAGREVRRNQLGAQPDTRRAEDVPPGASLQSSRGLQAVYDEELKAVKADQNRRYPSRGRRPGAMVPV